VTTLDTTIRKIKSVLEKIRGLNAGGFAQQDSSDALAEIEKLFQKHLTVLTGFDAGTDKSVVTNHCNIVLVDLFTYIPILGFLHRSRNASNAFELYGPLRRLAQSMIDQNTKLVMASEWNFSPYTLLQMPDLPSYVLIGMPASEAANALLAPLAGHEFGHSIWQLEDLESRYKPELIKAIIFGIRKRWVEYKSYFPSVTDENQLGNAGWTWIDARRWAVRQCEEVYCDLQGLRVFGEGYLNAFAYLLAPGLTGSRVPYYPTVKQRVSYLEQAAKHYSVLVPDHYDDLFESDPIRAKRVDGFLQEIADDAVASITEQLVRDVDDYASRRKVVLPEAAEIARISERFRLLVPPDHPTSLPAIINAGWHTSNDSTIWQRYATVANKREQVLNELLLKSAQVLEVHERLASGARTNSQALENP